jgi:hypothetical protein
MLYEKHGSCMKRKDKIVKQHFVEENKTEIMQHVLEMRNIYLLRDL